MTGEWILAVDQGTTNTKAVLVDREGRIVYRASVPLEILQPQPGFVEQDPLALWQSVVQVVATCVRHAQSERASIAGIAISNQRETAMAWRGPPREVPLRASLSVTPSPGNAAVPPRSAIAFARTLASFNPSPVFRLTRS